MIDVVVVGNLERIHKHLETCRDLYAFRPAHVSVWGGEVLKGTDPLLVFLEAPGKERGERNGGSAKTWERLNDLQDAAHKRLVRVFVVSTGESFDSAEAQRAWMDYPIVIGYDLQGSLTVEDVRGVLREVFEMTAADGDLDETRPVGSALRLPAGEYAPHKFVSLFIGGMRNTLVRLRQIAEVMERHNPLPMDVKSQWKHPFGSERPSQMFDKVVKALYGGDRDRVQNASLPKDMKDLQESRFKEDPIAPHLLLLGETGTGKSLLARWLHRMRFEKVRDKKEERVQALFQDLNCGGLSPKLIDSELFGGVAGAWTSLTNNTPGKIFCACQGTLFLDEIGELPLSTQAVLLKFLDDGEYYPVGGHGEKLYIPTTVIAATNQPVEQLIAQGKFRRDLYERFRFRIRLPSLRERMDHFDHLVDFVLQNPSVNRETDGRRDVQAVSVRALDRLRRHPWPGNFRELEQVLWRAVSHARQEEKKTILPHHIVFDPGDFMV